MAALADAESQWEDIRSKESLQPFDLVTGPLVRVHVARFAEDHHELLFTAHHIVCDGWSFGMLMTELADAYDARKAGHLPKLPPAMPFAEYARHEVVTRDSQETLDAERFWVSKFEQGAPVLRTPHQPSASQR
ncbi:MAG: condensation domain-containing protein [Luteolibacter sp.]